MQQTPLMVIYIVVCTLCSIAVLGITSLSLTMFYKSYADPAVFTAINSITSGSIGAVAGLLTNLRQQAPNTTTLTTPAPDPSKVTVESVK